MIDDLDRMRADLNDAAIAGDWHTFDENLTSLIITMRQLRRENEQAWEQSGSDRADLGTALLELEVARADNAALIQGIIQACSLGGGGIAGLTPMLESDHPGAQMLADLEAARDVVLEAKAALKRGMLTRALRETVEDYDEVVRKV